MLNAKWKLVWHGIKKLWNEASKQKYSILNPINGAAAGLSEKRGTDWV